jgi:transcriptional regulator with XRE-family HTH domain
MPKAKRVLPIERRDGTGRPFAAIGYRLEATREALGLSRVELCTAIDCQQTRWSQYETGVRCITLEIALRIAEQFDVPLDWIYRGKRGQLPADLAAKLPKGRQG